MNRESVLCLSLVCLVASGGLLGCPPHNVTGPVSAFSATSTYGTLPLTVQFVDESTPGSAAITSWLWDFGDGDTSAEQNPVHIYTTEGAYDVSLTVTTSAGSDTETRTDYISVAAAPIDPAAEFTAVPTEGQAPLTVQFTDQSSEGSAPITEWLWNFGDGETSALQNPAHTYADPGEYTVSLTVVTSVASDVESKTGCINVTAPPVGPTANFEADLTSGQAPLTVHFTDVSEAGSVPITGWYWDFGDGETSTEQDPVHTFLGAGTYTTELTVIDTNDLSASASMTIEVGGVETILLPGDVPLEMVWISPGTFMMGHYAGEQDSYSHEAPQHQVTLTQGFWMGKYELTKAQWTAVMGTTPWYGQAYGWRDPDSPAVYVSWDNAQSFITALSSLTGQTFRMPSEAEWEYACRAGTTARFYWGDDPNYTVGNDYAWWAYNAWDVNERHAQVVGQKLPNAWGLYDMSGNVWEWCQDWWHLDYSGAPTDGSAWESPTGSHRVRRGGSWDGRGYDCRSAVRDAYYPSHAFYYIGFRLAR